MTDLIAERISAEPERHALFLDIDGTLIDLALTPDGVVVPQGLAQTLQDLSARLGGALALVTGRSLAYADGLFAPFSFPTAGLHGAEIRAGGKLVYAEPSAAFSAIVAALQAEMAEHPGVLVEDKGAAVALHYRLVPELEPFLEARMRHYAELAGADWALQLGKMVFELRPARSSKGDAVERFLQDDPFAHRLPVTIGDDLTDESMFAIANARGGISVFVGPPEAPTGATYRIGSPAEVRALVTALSRR